MTLELSTIGALTAFSAGVISFLSPCVLPLVPGYVSYIAGRAMAGDLSQVPAAMSVRVLGRSVCFVLGFSTVFVVLGASATALGHLLLTYRYELNLVGGAIVILFGLLLIGLLRFGWLQREFRVHGERIGHGPIGAYVLGLAFGFGWTPCIGPVLGAILTISATTVSLRDGVALLAVYSLGLGLPFVMAAGFTGAFLARIKLLRRSGRPLQVAAGIVMVVMGLAMMTGDLSTMSYWLLETFPVLARIG